MSGETALAEYCCIGVTLRGDFFHIRLRSKVTNVRESSCRPVVGTFGVNPKLKRWQFVDRSSEIALGHNFGDIVRVEGPVPYMMTVVSIYGHHYTHAHRELRNRLKSVLQPAT